MNRLTTFKIAAMAIAGVAALVAFLLFASNRGTSSNGVVSGDVSVWGSFRPEEIEPILNVARGAYPDLNITFTNKAEDALYTDFVNQAATNQSPDLVIVPISEVLSYAPFIHPIPKTSLSDRVVNEQFVDGIKPLNTELGMIGVPISLNPMLFIANKEYLQSIFVTDLPGTWEELALLTEQLARTEGINISQPVIPLGTITDTSESYGVLLSMFLQTRSAVVTSQIGTIQGLSSTDTAISFRSSSEGASSNVFTSLGSALDYFSAYARPGANVFSWSNELGNPVTLFKTKQLPLLMLSYQTLTENFSRADIDNLTVTLMPLTTQDVSTQPLSYADGYIAIIPRLAKNTAGAYGVAFNLISPQAQEQIPEALHQYPVLRPLLASKKDDPLDEIARKASIQSLVIPFPGRAALKNILSTTLSSYTSGRTSKESAMIEFSEKVSETLSRLQLR